MQFVSWIKACISIPIFSCLINGEDSRYLRSNRGICQGDPLSPYLYIIVAQILSCQFHKVVDDKLLTLFKFKNRISISHLMYADDILVYFRVNRRSCKTIKDIFKVYETLTNQRINLGKTEMFHSSQHASQYET